MPSPGTPLPEFVSHILELAIADSAQAWLTAMRDAASHEVADMPDAPWASGATPAVTCCYDGHGDLSDGSLTGHWPSVIGAQGSDWLLLPARNGSPCRVLVAREDARVEAAGDHAGLGAADVSRVTIADLAAERVHVVAREHGTAAIRAAAGATSSVVGSAVGVWRRHVEQLRVQLATSYRSAEITDAAAARVARAASDLDAATLQVTTPPSGARDLAATVWEYRQAVARARSAADRLLEGGRHALDAANPVTQRWVHVDAGSRLAARLLDALVAPLR
jgi:3-hydroxy-9,10-secoandrosta-1,3,5(10)-triene-9,17-dione monooxygenase